MESRNVWMCGYPGCTNQTNLVCSCCKCHYCPDHLLQIQRSDSYGVLDYCLGCYIALKADGLFGLSTIVHVPRTQIWSSGKAGTQKRR